MFIDFKGFSGEQYGPWAFCVFKSNGFQPIRQIENIQSYNNNIYSSPRKLFMYFHSAEESIVVNEPTSTFFPYDPDITDFTLVVQGKKFHVAKVVLIDASTVFRKMFMDDFKEKTVNELELPGKDFSSFELFLRCIYSRGYSFTGVYIF